VNDDFYVDADIYINMNLCKFILNLMKEEKYKIFDLFLRFLEVTI
jgi:hypothetical protein